MSDARIGHLLRRAAFGASADDLAIFDNLSYGQAVDRLVNYERLPDDVDGKIGQSGYVGTVSNGPFSPNTTITDARQRWLFRMLYSQRPLQEKMALFWHNQFATGYTKIAGVIGAANATRLMAGKASEDPAGQAGQIELFRARALGSFSDLLVAVAQDPAMLYWLDGNSNTRLRPQENFGRELMELFTRGVGFYTENDVYAAARVFTGWNLQVTGASANPSFRFFYNANAHETAAKTFSFPMYPDGGQTIPARSAADGMQDGLDLIRALALHPETATRLMTKLYGFFVSELDTPSPNFIGRLSSLYTQNGTQMAPVISYLLASAEFQAPSASFARYSWPAEFVVRAMKETGATGFSLGSTLSPLSSMGQQLFDPPDVAGWSLGRDWFSTGAMLTRMNFASTLTANQKFRLAGAATVARESPRALVNFMLSRLTADGISGASYDDLLTYASSVSTWTGSDPQLQTKAPGLAHLILGSAEYQFI
jgi:uncharacterized protein (DUF1800 family)